MSNNVKTLDEQVLDLFPPFRQFKQKFLSKRETRKRKQQFQNNFPSKKQLTNVRYYLLNIAEHGKELIENYDNIESYVISNNISKPINENILRLLITYYLRKENYYWHLLSIQDNDKQKQIKSLLENGQTIISTAKLPKGWLFYTVKVRCFIK